MVRLPVIRDAAGLTRCGEFFDWVGGLDDAIFASLVDVVRTPVRTELIPLSVMVREAIHPLVVHTLLRFIPPEGVHGDSRHTGDH